MISITVTREGFKPVEVEAWIMDCGDICCRALSFPGNSAITIGKAEPAKEPKTYHVGQKFEHEDGDRYILVAFARGYAALICLDDGMRFTDSVPVGNLHKITEDEFKRIAAEEPEHFKEIKDD